MIPNCFLGGGYLGQVAIDRIAAQIVSLKKKRFS
jgi:hypothetical protein